MKKALLLSIVICVTIMLGRDAYGATIDAYVVRNVQGTVLTRLPTSARWFPVRAGETLLEGQLIQVTANATVTIEERSSRAAAGVAKDRMQLTLTKPIVTRVSNDLLREIRLSTFFINRPNTSPALPVRFSPPPLTLADAWERLAAIVTGIPPRDVPEASLTELERQGMALGLSAKRIRIIAPTANTVVQASDWPAEFKVTWAKPNSASMRFLVYVWRSGSPRGAPVGETRLDYYTVKLRRPGTHFVQVTSADGTWQSAALAVHAMEPMARSVVEAGSRSSPLEVTGALSPRYPPDKFVFTSTVSPDSMLLAWESTGPWRSPTYVVEVRKADGKLVHSLQTRTKDAAVNLEPGQYTWSVALAGSKLRSETRRFEILGTNISRTVDLRRSLVRKLIASGQDATVSLNDGY